MAGVNLAEVLRWAVDAGVASAGDVALLVTAAQPGGPDASGGHAGGHRADGAAPAGLDVDPAARLRAAVLA